MAYNDARSGGVFATIDSDEARRKEVIAKLTEYMSQNPKVKHWAMTEKRKPEKLQNVALDDNALKQMFDRQGVHLLHRLGARPGAAYRRHWVSKRYRLQEDPKTRALTGNVPSLAYKQLMGLEPIYHGQIAHPESFAQQYWAKSRFKPVDTTRMLDAAQPDLLKTSSILVIKRASDEEDDRPFTIAVDLDGTPLAESEGPSIPTR